MPNASVTKIMRNKTKQKMTQEKDKKKKKKKKNPQSPINFNSLIVRVSGVLFENKRYKRNT